MPLMDVRGDWSLTQSQGSVVQLHLDQQILEGHLVLTGHASHDNGSKTSIDLRGTLNGEGVGSTMVLIIKWSHGPIGEYHGTFSAFIPGFGSRLTGTVFDQTHPANQATWVSNKFFSF